MAVIGVIALALCLASSLYAVVAAILGARQKSPAWIKSAKAGTIAALLAATAASVVLVTLLGTSSVGVRYVYDHVNRALPLPYRISAFWSGQEGSLLLWLWFATITTAAVALGKQNRSAPAAPYILATLAITQAFLALVLLLTSNPFEMLPAVPPDGRGLNPLLQNIWMIVHPPVVFAAYAAYSVPFGLAIAGLVSGNMDADWLRVVRSWALLAWLLLGTGILMGAYWAYLELGWGGYWGWDPVENASLVPWLAGTAQLHSLKMQQRRQAFRRWNLWLIALTFLLCLLATFITRSGVIQSVHAFSRSPIGAYFMAFIALCALTFVVLLRPRRQALQDEVESEVLLSRESSFLFTNLLLCGTALVILAGTLFPALIEALRGQQVALATSFYERTFGPLALLILALLGICPWLSWRRTSPTRLWRKLRPSIAAAGLAALVAYALSVEQIAALLAFAICAFTGASILAVWGRDLAARFRQARTREPKTDMTMGGRNRHRYGAHLVHLGIVLIAVGVVGSSFYQKEIQIALNPGETVGLQGYTLTYQEYTAQELPDQHQFTALVSISRGSKTPTTLRPQKVFHWTAEQWVTEVAIHSTLARDLYLILAGLESDGLATLIVLINPLVAWLWIGAILLLAGGVIAWWPGPVAKHAKMG